jgi:Fe2+ or Zn2+ uptake regulation protein
VEPFSDPGLEREIDRLSKRVPLAVAEHEIVLRGTCARCHEA